MQKIDMIQNTDEWLKMRNNFIGASEANIIMGQSKFKTPLELWKQKIGEVKEGNKPQNFIQAKGHKMEEKMRNIMDMLYDTDFVPLVVKSDEYEFLMCSLDGYSESLGAVWENKYVGQDDYETVANGKMLMHYYPQVQHQLMLTGAPFNIFCVVADNKESDNPDFPFKYAYIEVKPDYKYMQDELLPALKDFWDKVKTKTSPDLSDNDRVNFDDDNEMVELLGKLKTRKEGAEVFSQEIKDIEKQIYKKLGKAKKAECNGVKITQSKSADKVVFDAKKFEENNEISEEYMKTQKGRITKRITFPKPSDSQKTSKDS